MKAGCASRERATQTFNERATRTLPRALHDRGSVPVGGDIEVPLPQSGIGRFANVVFRRGERCAITRTEKSAATDLFCRITDAQIVSLTDSTRPVEDRPAQGWGC